MRWSQRDIDKYMRKGLRGEILPLNPSSLFRHIVVIPVFDELNYLEFTLKSLGEAFEKYDGKVASLLVINHHPETEEHRKKANIETLNRLNSNDKNFVGKLKIGENLFWIDAASRADLEITGGVGHARKLGLDTALLMLEKESFAHSLLFSLDADSLVDIDYVQTVEDWFKNNPNYGAASLGFLHQKGSTEAEEIAIRHYEKYMTDYVDNLKWAKSPYAFYTVGSSVVARSSAYIACGGMRIRQAGEDFYFMQALKKVALMGMIEKVLVYPAARESDRVPFGTGASVKSQLNGQELEFYKAEAFAELKELLELASEENLLNIETFRERLSHYSREFLENRDFFSVWGKLLKNLPKRKNATREAFDCWFDALKTVQFIKNFYSKN